jgi:MoaA/NifB/PqqE/SkfB family radical SAM enzyme
MAEQVTMEYHPRIVSWNITGACHLRCAHCYLDARRPWPGELTTEEGLRLIDQMAEAGTELLILTGGEPLLRKDLLTLSRHAAQKGIHVVLGTTGMHITLEMARSLRESGVAAAGISIDSLDPARHDAFRGVPGAWRGAVRGIESCREAGLDVVVHTTALKMNQREIPEIVRFASGKGARAFHLFFLVCTGRGEEALEGGGF